MDKYAKKKETKTEYFSPRSVHYHSQHPLYEIVQYAIITEKVLKERKNAKY